jgi:hypothetical protein
VAHHLAAGGISHLPAPFRVAEIKTGRRIGHPAHQPRDRSQSRVGLHPFGIRRQCDITGNELETLASVSIDAHRL